MIYITGDTHGDFRRIFDICMRFETSADDIMIILGDAGINFCGDFKDQAKKDYIAAMPITLFCIHGNHEQRPFTIPSYEETEWHGVKGETHDATLYLETEKSGSSDIRRILQYWGIGEKGAKAISEYSRKCVYVGMSRPRKLLCLAVRAGTYEEEKKAFELWKTSDCRV